MSDKLKSAFAAAKKSAIRELGMLLFMVVFGLAAAVVAAPFIFAAGYLPDWAWLVLFGCGVVWMLFGETISSAISAYRGQENE